MCRYLKLGELPLKFFNVSRERLLNQGYIEMVFCLLDLQLSTEKIAISEEDYGFLTESLRNP